MKMAETSYKKTDKNYANLLHQQMLINAQQHNKSTASISFPQKDTKGRYRVKIKTKCGNGKKTTQARAKAVADIRNAISFGVMNQIMVNSVHPALILNSDPTQYAAALDCHENVKVVYVPKSEPETLDRGERNGNKVLSEEKVGSLTNYLSRTHLWIREEEN